MLNQLSFSTIKRHWFTVVALTLLCAAAAFGLSTQTVPLYRSTASLYITLNFGATANELNQGSNYTANQMVSFGQLAASPVVLDPVIRQLGLNTTALQLEKSVTISTPRDTVIMDIAVTSTSARRAADIANAIADQAGAVIEDFAPQTSEGKPSVIVRTVAEATPPTYQFSPNKKLNTLVGAVLGALLGVVGAILLAILDNRVRNAASLVGTAAAPHLGSLRRLSRNARDTAVVLTEPSSAAAEEYRQLRSNLHFATMRRHPVVVVVSSSVPNEGKSTVATNLAAVMAESGERVLLIDADLRKPSIAMYTHLADGVGLSEVLVGVAPLRDAVQPLGTAGVDVLVGGSVPPNPGELVASTHMADVLAQARANYDVVVIDTAPLLAVADAMALAQQADGVVLVARAGKTSKTDLGLSLTAVRGSGGNVFGVVLNDAAPRSDRPLRDYHDYQAPPASAVRNGNGGTAGTPAHLDAPPRSASGHVPSDSPRVEDDTAQDGDG